MDPDPYSEYGSGSTKDHKAPEYGSNTDPDPVPDPQHWRGGSGGGGGVN